MKRLIGVALYAAIVLGAPADLARSATVTTALSGTGTAASGGPSPPPLNAPIQVFQAGVQHTYGSTTCTPAGNGTTNDQTCFNAALQAGDMQINAGTYLLSTGSLMMPTGRQIRCGAGTAPDPTVILKYTSTAAYDMLRMVNTNNQTIFGCTFAGPNYNVNAIPGCQSVRQTMVDIEPTGSGQHIANNDFNGVGGFNGAFEAQSFGAANSPNHITVEWNTFEHCGYRGVELGGVDHVTAQHNTSSDCSEALESSGPTILDTNDLLDHETVNFVFGAGIQRGCFGTGYANTRSANHLSGGVACGGTGSVCDFSSDTVSNSLCDDTGAGSSAAIDESIQSPSSGQGCVFINNMTSGTCVVH